MISEQILEIRFKPNPKALDNRGHWAGVIANELGLEHWKIENNRIDVFTKDPELLAFVSFKNFGMTVIDAPTSNYFNDKAKKFISVIAKLPDFSFPLPIDRIGVRFAICHDVKTDLKDVSSTLRDTFIKSESLKTFGDSEDVVETALALYFKATHGQINIRLSSNSENEIKQRFRSHPSDKLPKNGLITDLDYFSSEKKQLAQKDLAKEISEYVTEINNRYASISSLLNI